MTDSDPRYRPDGPYAWTRLAALLALGTTSGVGMWSVVVALPTLQAEFGVDRGEASLPYTATMVGFAAGGILMGRLLDRFGLRPLLIFAAAMLAGGYLLAAQATTLWQFMAAQTLLIGMLGSAVGFAPLVADATLWFRRRRGIAVSIVASGNYLAGTVWPPILQYAIDTVGWRQAHVMVGLFCLAAMVPLALLLRRRPRTDADADATGPGHAGPAPAPLPQGRLQIMLVVAGLSCCIAMSMPQVHIVAYCGDLGYGVARGAEMLSLMLGFGIVSRLASGLIADRIGGAGTLLLGSTLQCLALFFYLPFDGLTPLYIVSALFGLSQGGIVPSYALIVRDHFPAREAGRRISLVLMMTVVGMAIGGWMSGEIYAHTGSYRAAFLNGIAFNLLNMSIAFWLLLGRLRARRARVAA